MKAKLERIETRQYQSLVAYRHVVPRFEFAWHYHPEAELTYIIRGQGKRLIGDCYADFAAGDWVLLGPNLPHTWESTGEGPEGVEAIVVQFVPEVWAPIWGLPEFANIAKLLGKGSRGWRICVGEDLCDDMLRLPTLPPPEQALAFVALLQKLTSKVGESLASALFKPVRNEEYGHRLNAICKYIHQEASRPLPLDEVAEKAHLSASAFCKFFKRAMGTTYSDYLNDIRIARACILLTEEDMPIADVALACGYETLSYFNRIFKRKKGFVPRVLRRTHR